MESAAGHDEEFAERYTQREEARRRFGRLADDYARFHGVADPPADELVAAFAEGDGQATRRAFLRALERGIDAVPEAPPPVVRLFEEVDPIPPWADFERMNLGARAYQRTGPAMGIVLSALSLMGGYTSGPGVKPLAHTGQLDRMAPIRLLETGKFIIDVAQEGGLRRFSEGFKATIQVRVVHASVRRRLLASGRWNARAWGLPINQADMVGTLLMFSYFMVEGARRIGFSFTSEESEAILHLWRYCGHLSGIRPALLFTSEAEAKRLTELLQLIDPGPDADCVALAHALRRVPLDVATTPLGRALGGAAVKYIDGMTRSFLGDAHADQLELPNRHWKYAVYPTRAVFGSLDGLRRLVPGGSPLASMLGNAFLKFSNGQSLARMQRPAAAG